MARVYSGLDVNADFGGRFPWKSKLIDVGDGVMQAVVDEGPRDAPVTLVCFHGNPTWSFLWREVIRDLSRDVRVVAIDHVGFGRSDKPREAGYYTLGRHIENATRTLDALGVRNAVPLVHDWGGPIGLGWATRHPDRVKGVIVTNSWAFVKGPGSFDVPWLFKVLVTGKAGWKRVTEQNFFTEVFLARSGTRRLAPEELAAYRAAHPRPDDRVGEARFPVLIPERSDREHPEWRTMEAIEDGLEKLAEKPACIVWGTRDRAFRKAQLQRWTTVFSRIDGPHSLANAAHYLMEDAPHEIPRHVRAFVQREWLS